ncbi:hypothetical protein PSEUDO8Z_140033 [Pseudomonas sp. 8Z]|nr:hypothetical protein PSEUDO8Z_140033 [Pseudomonas sp. 8Z]
MLAVGILAVCDAVLMAALGLPRSAEHLRLEGHCALCWGLTSAPQGCLGELPVQRPCGWHYRQCCGA